MTIKFSVLREKDNDLIVVGENTVLQIVDFGSPTGIIDSSFSVVDQNTIEIQVGDMLELFINFPKECQLANYYSLVGRQNTIGTILYYKVSESNETDLPMPTVLKAWPSITTIISEKLTYSYNVCVCAYVCVCVCMAGGLVCWGDGG